jgi:hypothetical protein
MLLSEAFQYLATRYRSFGAVGPLHILSFHQAIPKGLIFYAILVNVLHPQ